jgi:hypothetical protein
VENLSLYCVKAIVTDPDCQRQLKELAEKHEMMIFNMNPIVREKQYPTLFNPRVTTPHSTERSENGKFEENKEQAPSVSNTPGLSGY